MLIEGHMFHSRRLFHPHQYQLVSVDRVALIKDTELRPVAPSAIAIRRQVRKEVDFLIISLNEEQY